MDHSQEKRQSVQTNPETTQVLGNWQARILNQLLKLMPRIERRIFSYCVKTHIPQQKNRNSKKESNARKCYF